MQFKDGGDPKNDSGSETSFDRPIEDNAETKATLNSNISVQKKPEDSLKQLGAKAYTQGRNIVLPDTFRVDKKDDQKTFLHEVSHAMTNQNSSPKATTSRNGVPVNDSEQLERDADKKSEELHGKIGISGISQIIGENSSFVSSQDQVI